MSGSAWLPSELVSLVEGLERNQRLHPEQLAAISRWRLACGDGRAAARWQRWSLHPPAREDLQDALRQLLLLQQQPDLAQRLGPSSGWHAVLLALDQGHAEQARALQRNAIAAAEPLDPQLSLRLAGLWQQLGEAEAALVLLRPVAQLQATPALCNAVAHLHEQLQQPSAAAPWWDLSLNLEPDQRAVLMQRCRNALALGDPGLAWHLAQRLLEQDPGHAVGQELRVEALTALQAFGSLREALVPLVRQRRERFLRQAADLASWWRPRRRRQNSWRAALPAQLHGLPLVPLGPPRPLPAESLTGCSRIALMGSRDGLELAGAFAQAAPQGELWDLCSREPHWSQTNLRQLLPKGWQLRRWPRWQPLLHGPLQVLVIAPHFEHSPANPGAIRTLRWQRSLRAWQEGP